MSRITDDEIPKSDWVTYDPRMEQLVWLRSVAEDTWLSHDERQDAYDRAGRETPTEDEWTKARWIAEQRHAISRQRKADKGHKLPRDLSPVTPWSKIPPQPDGEEFVSPERGARLLKAIFGILTHGNPDTDLPPYHPKRYARDCRTNPEYRGIYWYHVMLERKRRDWMTQRGLAYSPRLGVWPEDLGDPAPRRDPEPEEPW